jgi:hypothetical protein
MTRNEYTTGLRALADLIEQRPELELPAHGKDINPFIIFTHGKETFANAARALGSAKKTYSEQFIRLTLEISPHFFLQAVDYRASVCEKKVTGKRLVTKLIPSEYRLEEVEEEIIEWECGSILAHPEA